MNKFTSLLLSTEVLSSSNIKEGIDAAKNEVEETLTYVVNFGVVPLGLIVLLGVLAILITKAAASHKQGQGGSEKLVPILIVVICMLLLGSLPFWGWKMIGM